MTDAFVPVDLDKVLDEFEQQGGVVMIILCSNL